MCSAVASPAPKSMSGPLPGSKTVPKAEVAPLLRAQPKEEPEPPAAEAEENDYVVPDEHRHDDHKERHGENQIEYFFEPPYLQ